MSLIIRPALKRSAAEFKTYIHQRPQSAFRALIALLMPILFEIQIPFFKNDLHLPIFDLGYSDGNGFLILLLCGYAIGLIVFVGFSDFWGGVICSLTTLLILNGASEDRWQFFYLPPFVFMVFAQESLMRRSSPSRETDSRIYFWRILLGSIYGFGALHKAVAMYFKPHSFFEPFAMVRSPVFDLICSDPHCWVFHLLGYGAVPFEVALCLLTLSNFRRLRISAAFVFHSIVAILALHQIWTVSLMLLLLHTYLLCLEDPMGAQRIFRSPKYKWILLWVVGVFYAGFGGGALSKIAGSLAMIVPTLYLASPLFVRARQHNTVLTNFYRFTFRHRIDSGTVLVSFTLIVTLLFGFSPLFIGEPYSLRTVGWTILIDNPLGKEVFRFESPNSACFKVRMGYSLVYPIFKSDSIEYIAYRPQDLQRLRHYLMERPCYRMFGDRAPPLEIRRQ